MNRIPSRIEKREFILTRDGQIGYGYSKTDEDGGFHVEAWVPQWILDAIRERILEAARGERDVAYERAAQECDYYGSSYFAKRVRALKSHPTPQAVRHQHYCDWLNGRGVCSCIPQAEGFESQVEQFVKKLGMRNSYGLWEPPYIREFAQWLDQRAATPQAGEE